MTVGDIHSYFFSCREPIHADVIFVHGLLGGPFRTWRQEDKLNIERASKIEDSDRKINYTFCWPKVRERETGALILFLLHVLVGAYNVYDLLMRLRGSFNISFYAVTSVTEIIVIGKITCIQMWKWRCSEYRVISLFVIYFKLYNITTWIFIFETACWIVFILDLFKCTCLILGLACQWLFQYPDIDSGIRHVSQRMGSQVPIW